MNAVHIDFPLQIGPSGRTATTGYADHVRDLIEQLLFTRPGERYNRPQFGCGLLDLTFEPNSEVLAGVLQKNAEGALQSELGDVITVQDVKVTAEESTLRIEVSYHLRATGELVTTTVEGSAP